MEKRYGINRIMIVLSFAALASNCSKAQTGNGRAMKAAEKTVALQFGKWQQGEESFFELLAEDAEWTVSGNSPVSGTYRGKGAFMEQAVSPIVEKFKTPLKPKLVSLTSDERFVWLHFTATATTASDATYENSYLWKMQLKNGKISHAVAFLDTHALTQLMGDTLKENTMEKTMEETEAYIGMWVTEDGYIRHELLPNGRYDEARGARKSAYQGDYNISGNHIDYKDDTGFTADGEFRDGILYHAGMVLHKEHR